MVTVDPTGLTPLRTRLCVTVRDTDVLVLVKTKSF